jgi:hypothetical protein
VPFVTTQPSNLAMTTCHVATITKTRSQTLKLSADVPHTCTPPWGSNEVCTTHALVNVLDVAEIIP